MISFERTFDYSLVKQIITHPMIYPRISDDFSPKPEDYQPVESDTVWYVLARRDGILLGVWILFPESRIRCQVHTCLLPIAYGTFSHEAIKELPGWVWSHTEFVRATTEVPEFNRLALRFAKESGMKQYGVNPKAFMREGILWNVILLGMSKPGV